MSDRKSNSLMAAVDRCETGRAGRLAVHLIMPLLREACLEDGLIVVPGFPDGELLCPTPSGFAQGRKIKSIGSAENLFGEQFGMTRSAVPRDDVLRCQLREAGKTCRNDRKASRQSFH